MTGLRFTTVTVPSARRDAPTLTPLTLPHPPPPSFLYFAMGGDQPDWTELGKIPSGSKRSGPSSRAPDWQHDPKKLAAKAKQEALERGELVVAVGPFCVPCGKRFAKQTVYDAHLSGKKHLAALQRMGRHEEAMVCQLDVEAKRRKMQSQEEERLAAAGFGEKAGRDVTANSLEDEAAAAARKAERDQKLLERAMLPMPSCVAATSVYAEGNADEGSGGSSDAVGMPSSRPSASGATIPAGASPLPLGDAAASDAALAAAGAGTLRHSYTGGMQDGTGEVRTNRHTTGVMAASHRKMAEMSQSWDFLRHVGEAPPSVNESSDV